MGDLDATAKQILERALDSYAPALCLLWLRDKSSGELLGSALAHDTWSTEYPTAQPETLLQLCFGPANWVFRNAKPLILNDSQQWSFPGQRLGRKWPYRIMPFMCVPAVRHDEVIGAIAVIGPESAEFTEADTAELSTIA